MDEKIFDYNFNNAKLRLKVCPNCGTVFVYGYKDIYYKDIYSMSGYYVDCPVCDKALLTIGHNWSWED